MTPGRANLSAHVAETTRSAGRRPHGEPIWIPFLALLAWLVVGLFWIAVVP